MAIPDGKPATDFSAMNREWVRGVAAEAAAAGGLPSVSGSDNGKVLTVVSGEWEAATPSGGSGIPAPANPSDGDVLTYDSTDSAWVAAAPESDILVVTITEEESGGDYIYTFSPSIDDIVAAKEAGKIVIGMFDGGAPTLQVDCYKNATDDWGISVIFPSFSADVSGIHIFIDTYRQISSDESMTYNSAEGVIAIEP